MTSQLGFSSTSTTEGLRQGVLTNNTEGFSSETHSTHAVLIAVPAARRPEAQCVLARKPQHHGYLLRQTTPCTWLSAV